MPPLYTWVEPHPPGTAMAPARGDDVGTTWLGVADDDVLGFPEQAVAMSATRTARGSCRPAGTCRRETGLRPAFAAPGATLKAVSYLDAGCFNDGAGFPVS